MIIETDPGAPGPRALLERHLAFCRGTTAPEDVHALDLDGLRAENVTFFSLTEDGDVLAVGALKDLGDGHGEIKSMHTAAESRGRGLGERMVDHLLAVARARGMTRISLETGAGNAFAAPRRLYARAGFEPCGPFADYPDSPNSTWMTLEL